jgi:impB/mucB/samB family C-terminal domain
MIKQYLYELIDELIERIKNNKYQFRTVGIKLVRTDFSIETREKSYTNYQSERNSIESIIEELLNKFILEDNLSSSLSSNVTIKKYYHKCNYIFLNVSILKYIIIMILFDNIIQLHSPSTIVFPVLYSTFFSKLLL